MAWRRSSSGNIVGLSLEVMEWRSIVDGETSWQVELSSGVATGRESIVAVGIGEKKRGKREEGRGKREERGRGGEIDKER
jgi:hypothetical protein